MKKYEPPKISTTCFETENIMTLSSVNIDGGTASFPGLWINPDVDGESARFIDIWER